jgi:ketosteroid isomerase-like protein
MQKPTLKIWTDAWLNADAAQFKSIYSKEALVFPPNKPNIQGNEAILDFMKGGFGKVEVLFIAKEVQISGNLAFEYGVFQDKELETHIITGEGKYAVTWILENSVWKILCHTWSLPIKF